jgi:hypothetical protein
MRHVGVELRRFLLAAGGGRTLGHVSTLDSMLDHTSMSGSIVQDREPGGSAADRWSPTRPCTPGDKSSLAASAEFLRDHRKELLSHASRAVVSAGLDEADQNPGRLQSEFELAVMPSTLDLTCIETGPDEHDD